MKITKEELNKMIQEELDAYLSETDVEDITLEADEEMEDMPDAITSVEPNEELMASLRNLYDVLQGMFAEEEEAEDEAEEEIDETVELTEEEVTEEEVTEVEEEVTEEVEESLNESVNRFKKLANIRG